MLCSTLQLPEDQYMEMIDKVAELEDPEQFEEALSYIVSRPIQNMRLFFSTMIEDQGEEKPPLSYLPHDRVLEQCRQHGSASVRSFLGPVPRAPVNDVEVHPTFEFRFTGTDHGNPRLAILEAWEPYSWLGWKTSGVEECEKCHRSTDSAATAWDNQSAFQVAMLCRLRHLAGPHNHLGRLFNDAGIKKSLWSLDTLEPELLPAEPGRHTIRLRLDWVNFLLGAIEAGREIQEDIALEAEGVFRKAERAEEEEERGEVASLGAESEVREGDIEEG